MNMQNDYDEIKRRIRKLKQFEIRIRFNGRNEKKVPLVWDHFFDLRDMPLGKAKYTLETISVMDSDEYKNITDEYFSLLYYSLYKETGMTAGKTFNPDILERLDLPFYANENDIKKKFRQLAIEYHPDTGGDTAKFIELRAVYEKLIRE